MKWKWRDARTETCSMFYLESEEEGCILEVTAVTAEDNPDLNLIASAPLLLSVLDELAGSIHYDRDLLEHSKLDWHTKLEEVNRAINKARGV